MKRSILLVLLVALAAPSDVRAQARPAPPAAAQSKPVDLKPTDPIPVDPNVRIGKLDNGLTYYVRRNTEPANRAELQLVVNAGSVLEAENERGIAHFLEHMLFNGTRRFPGADLVNFLERTGMEFGPDVNAYTSFDETVYQLKIATDKKEILDKAFDVLVDWAGGATLAPDQIDKERGVIVEEWRLRDKNAGGRIRDKVLPILLGSSRYTTRLPIGDMEIIRTAPAERFRQFYERWYRPDLMAVLAVGDFDPAAIETIIRTQFASLPKRTAPVARPSFEVPRHKGTTFGIVTDPENPTTSFQILVLQDAKPARTAGDFREDIEAGLVQSMLNTRLAEVSRKPDAAFLFAFASQGGFVRPVESAGVGAQVHEGRVTEALDAVLTEVERVRRHGFTDTELVRAKESMLRGFERRYLERDKLNSASIVSDYVDHFLTGEAIPSVEFSYDFSKRVVPAVTLADVNRKAGELVAKEGRVVIVTAPEKPGSKPPTEAELSAALERVLSKPIDPYVDAVAGASLIEKAPIPAEITSERTIPELGVTEVVLANGIRVLMKQTDFKNDEVLFTSYSPGGSSIVSDADFLEADIADAVASQSGVGAFDLTSLQKLLSGKQVSVSPNISSLGEGFGGRASPRDLELLFQLVHLYATAPRIDRQAFDLTKNQFRSFLQNRSLAPTSALQDAVIEALFGKSPRFRLMTIEELDALDFERVSAIYRDRFMDMSDSTFVFVGSFDPLILKQLARTYLGTLPTKGRKEAWRDMVPDPPAGVVERVVRKGQDERSIVQIIFTGPIEATEDNRRLLSALDHALSIRIREELREERSGIYSPGVSSNVQRIPDQRYSITISFSCDPKRVDELSGAVFTLIEDLQKNGPSADLLAKVKEQESRTLEEQKRTNGFWLGSLSRLATTPGADMLDITRFDAIVAALSREKLQRAAQDYLRKDRFVKVVLNPGEPVGKPVEKPAGKPDTPK